MRCFFVLVHGKLEWGFDAAPNETQPAGFVCPRYVLAGGETRAQEIATLNVQRTAERRFSWLSNGETRLSLSVDEILPARLYKLLWPLSQSFVFYEKE